jgi:hypothetical protein
VEAKLLSFLISALGWMRMQLHALAALLSTKERLVLFECEVRHRAIQDIVEGNILMLSRIERS